MTLHDSSKWPSVGDNVAALHEHVLVGSAFRNPCVCAPWHQRLQPLRCSLTLCQVQVDALTTASSTLTSRLCFWTGSGTKYLTNEFYLLPQCDVYHNGHSHVLLQTITFLATASNGSLRCDVRRNDQLLWREPACSSIDGDSPCHQYPCHQYR